MPQVSVKAFFLDNPSWPQPPPSTGDNWSLYHMGRAFIFGLGAGQWFLGNHSFSTVLIGLSLGLAVLVGLLY